MHGIWDFEIRDSTPGPAARPVPHAHRATVTSTLGPPDGRNTGSSAMSHFRWCHPVLTQPADRRADTVGDLTIGSQLLTEPLVAASAGASGDRYIDLGPA